MFSAEMVLESSVLGWVDSDLQHAADMVGEEGEVATWRGVLRRITSPAPLMSCIFVKVGVMYLRETCGPFN